VKAGARKQLGALQPALKLTDEQVTRLEPSMTTALQGKLDVIQKLGDGGRVGVRDKLKAKRAMDGINGDLEKAMSAIVSPDQLAGYQKIQADRKARAKAK
jgi:hypothetical protein